MAQLMLTDEYWSKLRNIMLEHSESIREQIQSKGAIPIIPRRKNSKIGNQDIDWFLYKCRHLVENFFARVKHFRAVATRFDKLKRNDDSPLHTPSPSPGTRAFFPTASSVDSSSTLTEGDLLSGSSAAASSSSSKSRRTIQIHCPLSMFRTGSTTQYRVTSAPRSEQPVVDTGDGLGLSSMKT